MEAKNSQTSPAEVESRSVRPWFKIVGLSILSLLLAEGLVGAAV